MKSDIVIIGAALNGLAAALAIGGRTALRPLDIVLIDRTDPRQFSRDVFDGRASAITAASKRMLEALGVWEGIALDAQPMNEIIVTDAREGAEARPALLHFGDAEAHRGPSAYMV
jgi:2-octaprenyl-6-methoxyphenol hydroxylase